MPFIDTNALEMIERLPGWQRRYFHSPSMTFAHYNFKRGSFIHEHLHPQEEVYEVIEGELELTIDGTKQVARPCLVKAWGQTGRRAASFGRIALPMRAPYAPTSCRWRPRVYAMPETILTLNAMTRICGRTNYIF
jgi:hypothetical protein